MKYAKLELNKIVQMQPYTGTGFIEVPDNVCPGMILENGNWTSYRILKIIDELYIQDTDAEAAKQLEEAQEVLTTKKIDSLDKLVITHNTVAYDANGKAIGNMAAVMGIANFKFNQYTSVGALLEDGTRQVLTNAEAYETVYKSTIVWKGNDNLSHTVQIESICETLEKSMFAVSDILGL